uniref:Uncharacterized protein n=1 Tax=archaeon enrichment culture clone 1(2010) TaxID=795325 RepID=D9CGF9_9ARCH|nr:hypothetical protein pHA1_gp35 [archaeon enrichment culture clone 1(2010)]
MNNKKTITILGYEMTEEEYNEAVKELKEGFDTLWVTMPEGLRQRLIVSQVDMKRLVKKLSEKTNP